MQVRINPFLLYFIFCEGIWGLTWLPVRIFLPTTLGSTFLSWHCINRHELFLSSVAGWV
jgi:hypothetical protein